MFRNGVSATSAWSMADRSGCVQTLQTRGISGCPLRRRVRVSRRRGGASLALTTELLDVLALEQAAQRGVDRGQAPALGQLAHATGRHPEQTPGLGRGQVLLGRRVD